MEALNTLEAKCLAKLNEQPKTIEVVSIGQANDLQKSASKKSLDDKKIKKFNTLLMVWTLSNF